MRLLNFRATDEAYPQFGVVIDDSAVSFATLQRRFDRNRPELSDVYAYLRALPGSEDLARELAAKAEDKGWDFDQGERVPLQELKILPPVPNPPALIDFALAPKHMLNSGLTLVKHEKAWPVSSVISAIIRRDYAKNRHAVDFKCYKGNHNAIIGDGDVTFWPNFCSYLDVEAELGVVVGVTRRGMDKTATKAAIAGYMIFNDFSARDVQWPELMGRLGLARFKDFDRSNGIGPFLVTSDEVPNPLSLDVSVTVGKRYRWKGHTSDYTAHPAEVIEYLTSFQTVLPGTIVGMGTVPGCCGLDRDEWLLPGELVEITFEKLGTLRQPIPSDVGPLGPSRWAMRPELERFMKNG